jgi:Txe/YoeB family toxin of Txe-Axe toxin-antitoxin module
MSSEENTHPSDNVYAFGEDFTEHVFVSDAQKGKKYYCLGCKRQVVARKGDVRKHHYAHKANIDPNAPKCVYSDETYRHKLAKENLQMEGKIKVPSLLKYPPEGSEGEGRLIIESKFIESKNIIIEPYVFESDNGEIKWTKNKKAERSELFIKPDALLLDDNGQSILIVEFAATHKVDAEKVAKLFRIGINAVQVNVPKSSPEEIRQSILTSSRTKWIYNKEYEEADYFYLPPGNHDRIPSIEELGDEVYKENFNCRKNRIKNLIRSINRCLQSESYQSIEQRIIGEIQRVEKFAEATEEAERNLIEEQRQFEEQIYLEVEESFRVPFEQEKERYRDLEERYQRKVGELEPQREVLEKRRKKLERLINKIKNEQASIPGRTENIQGEAKNLKRRITEEREISKGIRDQIQKIPDSIKREFEERRIEIRARIEEKWNVRPGGTEEEIRAEFEERRRRIFTEIKTGNIGQHGQISATVHDFNQTMELAKLYPVLRRDRDRFREATKLIQNGSWKNWIK